MMNGGMMAGCPLMTWGMWLGAGTVLLLVIVFFWLFYRLVVAVEALD